MHTVLLNKSNFCKLSAILQIMVAIFFFCCPHVTLLPPIQLSSLIIYEFLLFCLSSSTNLYICLSVFILCSLSLHLMCQTHTHSHIYTQTESPSNSPLSNVSWEMSLFVSSECSSVEQGRALC